MSTQSQAEEVLLLATDLSDHIGKKKPDPILAGLALISAAAALMRYQSDPFKNRLAEHFKTLLFSLPSPLKH